MKALGQKAHKKIFVALMALVAVLILAQVTYVGLVSYYPDFERDEFGIANTFAKEILDSQEKYRIQNGQFAPNIELLDGDLRGKKYFVSYSDEAPMLVRKLCEDCVLRKDGYKLIVALRNNNGAVLWSLDNKGNLVNLGSLDHWPF